MATLLPGALPILGTLGTLIIYKRHDLDKVIVRSKGGIDRKRLKKSEEFVNTRRVNKEFGGRSTVSNYIMSAFYNLKPLADYNIAGPLNALVKPIQEMDTTSEWGKRSILLSKQPRLLEGFSFNRRFTFESVIRNPIHFSIDKQQLKADIEIPALIPDVNFHVKGQFPMYSLVATLAFISDVVHTDLGYDSINEASIYTTSAFTDWYPVADGSPATTLNIHIPKVTLTNESYILMLGVGIRFGRIGADGQVKQLKRAGSAKIIGAV